MADATVTLGLNAAQLTTGLRRATSEVDSFSKRAKNSIGGMGSGLSTMVKGLGPAIAGLAIGSKIQSTIEHFSRISDLASRFDVSTDALQRLNFAASMSGTDLETTARALTILNKALDDPANKKAAEAFERLGLSIKSLKQADSFQQIQMLSAAFQKAQKTGDGFSEIMALLGKSGAELIPMLRLSAQELDNFSKTNVVSQEQVAQLEEMGDKLDAIKIKMTTLVGQGIIGAANAFDGLRSAAGDYYNYIYNATEALLNGRNASQAIRDAEEKLNETYKERAKIKAEEADAKAKVEKPDMPGDSVTDTIEKQKKGTYDIAKNLQDQARAASSILAPYQQFLDFLDQAKRKQDAINQANKEARKNSQLRVENQKNAAQSLEDEVRMLDARATGDEKKIKAAERELAIKEKSKEIQQQLGLTADKATAIATAIQDAKDKVEGKEGGDGGGRIMGYSWARQGGRDEARGRAAQRRAESDAKRAAAYSRGFGGLNEFYANQKDPMFARPVTPNLDRMKENPAGSSSPVVGAVQSLEQTIKALLTVD